MTIPFLTLSLPREADTSAFAAGLARMLRPGDVVLLAGPIGAGKSALARAVIRARLDNHDEDVPSPTFTLVQTYAHPQGDIWHCDLYRLSHPDEATELGLEDAFANGICLIEWPDRLGSLRPTTALTIEMAAGTDRHSARLSGPGDWQDRLSKALA